MNLTTVDTVQARLDWTLDTGERAVALGAIEDLSEDARFYGSETWTSATAPRQVINLVVRAVARYMRNPDGYTTSRAGDETVEWSDAGPEAGQAHFTEREQAIIASLANRTTAFGSAEITAWGPVKDTGPGYVPVSPDGYAGIPKDLPFYQDGVNLW